MSDGLNDRSKLTNEEVAVKLLAAQNENARLTAKLAEVEGDNAALLRMTRAAIDAWGHSEKQRLNQAIYNGLNADHPGSALLAELAKWREAAVTIRKTRRWLRQVELEEEPDEATTERARYDLDEALDLIERMADPKWTEGFIERVKAGNQERANLKAELARLRAVVEAVPVIKGWSWHDCCEKARAALAALDGVEPQPTPSPNSTQISTPPPRPEHVVLREAAEKILMRQPTRPIDSSPVWDSGYAEALAHLDRLAAEAEKGGA